MYTRPDDLSDEALAAALGAGWGLRVSSVEYVPVGFGSHHWRASGGGKDWFVNVDDLFEKPVARLTAALSTARALRDAGYAFVVAPERTVTGALVHTVADRYTVAVYAYVDGESRGCGPYPTRAERLAVLDLVAAVHRAGAEIRRGALVDDLGISGRDELLVAIDDVAGTWETGPYGESARALLAGQVSAISDALTHYDSLAATAASRPERFVLTHGEPHRGNTIVTGEGLVLIDWDTALIAPPERDLWALDAEDPQIRDDYAARTGVTPRPDALELYRIGWDLADISSFVGQFRRPHRETADTALAWESLNGYLDPTRWG